MTAIHTESDCLLVKSPHRSPPLTTAPIPGATITLGRDTQAVGYWFNQYRPLLTGDPLASILITGHHLGTGKVPLVPETGAMDNILRPHRRHKRWGGRGAAAMVRAHQQGAGQTLPLQRHQSLLGLPFDIGAQQYAALAIADAYHAAIVVTPTARVLGPEHHKREPLPMPLLTPLAEGGSLAEGIR